MVKLHIVTFGEWEKHPKIVALMEVGHTVTVLPDPPPDLILHPNAWRWDDGKWDFLDVALREARKGQPKRAPVGKAGPKPRGRKGSKGTAGE